MHFFLQIICNLYVEVVSFLEWEMGELLVQKQLGAVCLQGCCLQKEVDFAGNEARFWKKALQQCRFAASQRWDNGPEATSASPSPAWPPQDLQPRSTTLLASRGFPFDFQCLFSTLLGSALQKSLSKPLFESSMIFQH